MLLSQKKIIHHPYFVFSMIRPENSKKGRRASHLHSFCQCCDMVRLKIQASLGLKKIRREMADFAAQQLEHSAGKEQGGHEWAEEGTFLLSGVF